MPDTRTKAVNEILKDSAIYAINKAEKAIYVYACDCEIGKERVKAFEIYERIRTAMRFWVSFVKTLALLKLF